MFRILFTVISIVSFYSAANAATVLDFDTAPDDIGCCGSTHIEDGFKIVGPAFAYLGSGRAQLNEIGPYDSALDITSANGGLFAAYSFEIPSAFQQTYNTVTNQDFNYEFVKATGTTLGGQTLTMTLDPGQPGFNGTVLLPSAFNTFSAGDGLVSLTFGFGDYSAPNIYAQPDTRYDVDNVRVQAVPIPGSGLLAGMGMLGLIGASRFRKNRS